MADLENDEVVDYDFKLTEYPDVNQLETIFRHPKIWNEQRKMIRKYCDMARLNKGKINIAYKKKGKYGRYYTADTSILSGTNMWRRLRASLFADTEYDIDIKACHLQIFVNQLKKFNDDAVFIQRVIDNRDELFDEFYIAQEAIDRYNKASKNDYNKKDIIKKLLTRILYGGLFDNWVKEFNLYDDDFNVPRWFYEFTDEVKMGINVLMELDKLVMADIKLDCLEDEKQKWEIEQKEICAKDKRKKPKPFNPEDYKVSKSKIIGRYFQHKECEIIDKVYDFVKKEYKIKPTTYCYDGLQFRKKDIKNLDEFINNINSIVDVKFIVKDFDDKLEPFKLPKPSSYFDPNELLMMTSPVEQEEYFNKFYFKIHSLNGLCYINHDGELVKIKNEISHFSTILKWYDKYQWSSNLKTFYAFGNYPNKDSCPPCHYNTWTGFDVEKLNINLNELKKEEKNYDIILYHFKVVANFDEKVYEYLLNYFAWIFQKPDKKTNVCLLIKGKQGTGKTTLVENLLRKLMGKKYIYDTCDIDKIVANFNAHLNGKFMVVLNEATGKDTYGIIDKIKDMITRTELTLVYKGQDGVKVVDYINYCITTNNLKPMPITSDDRRFQVTECSDKHKGDVEYFKRLYEAIEDDNIMYAFYKFLMERKLENFNPERDRIMTEAAQDLHDLNKDPVEMFLEYIHSDEFDKYTNRYKMKELFDEYKIYLHSINYGNICNMPIFAKLLKQYCNKFNFKITHPNNVSTIQFSWVCECQVKNVENQ